MDLHFGENNLKIFTLNCWGLRFVSEHRQQRIKLIAQHLLEHNYDVVFLQEIWCQSDFDYIRTTTKSKYRFAHMFKNASILGTSGLVVLTTWTPNVFHFHPFSVNGSPFRPLHGDWFTSKGVGYVRIGLDGLNLHLFCTHMHAQYDENERIHDQYSVHRICQSYEMAKFINLMANCSGASNTKDLIVLAGDMNASSKELPYRLLVSLTGLIDCYKCKTNLDKKTNDNIEAGDALPKVQQLLYDDTDYCSTDDEDLITCGHRENTFTPQSTNSKNNTGKRIDFILFKLLDKNKNGYFDAGYAHNDIIPDKDMIHHIHNSLCKVEHIKILCKDESGLSFSDHQPVVANLKIYFAVNVTSKSDNSNSQLNSTEQINNLLEDDKMNGDSIAVIAGINTCQLNGDGYDKNIESHDKNDLDCGDGSNSLKSEFSFIEELDKFEEIGLLTGKPKSKSNILLEATETASKIVKSGPLQLKQIASNAMKSKLDPKASYRSHLLETTKSLLENYVADNRLTRGYCFCFVGLATIFLSCLVFVLLFMIQMTAFEVLFLVMIITIVMGLSAFLKFLTNRHERNAVDAILNAIKKEILLNQ